MGKLKYILHLFKMEFNQATKSYHNQASTESYNNQPLSEPLYGIGQSMTESSMYYGQLEPYPSPPSEPHPNPPPLTRAAESFCLSEMRKLEMEKALWKKDQQILNKEISRLNERLTEELERRTDYEFEKASLGEELHASYADNENLHRQLRNKCEELEKLRLRCADVENKLNAELEKRKTVVARPGTYQFRDPRDNHSAKSASWAEVSKLEEEKDRGGGRSRRTHQEPTVFSPRASTTARTSSSSSDDDDDRHGLWMQEDDKLKKGKSSTLTRKKESAVRSVARAEKSTDTATSKIKSQGHSVKVNQVDEDPSASRENIHMVNKKMAKNDKEIQKLEGCVQSLYLQKD